MSDAPRGPGWWVASDGRWYPPEQHPAPMAPRPGHGGSSRRWAVVLGGLAAVALVLAALALVRADDDGTEGVDDPGEATIADGDAGPGPGVPADEQPDPSRSDPDLEPDPFPGLEPLPGAGSDAAFDPALRRELAEVLLEGSSAEGTALSPGEADCVAGVLLDVLGPAAMREAIDTGGASFDALTMDDDPDEVLSLVNGVLACAPQLLGQ